MRKFFNNITVFIIIFIGISIPADWYYYSKVVSKDPANRGQISYSDFKVFWSAGYNLRHHILRYYDHSIGREIFKPLWFLDPGIRSFVSTFSRPGAEYTVYNKNEEFYHFRYSPFAAFIVIPFGKITPPGNALLVWSVLINLSFLAALLLSIRLLNKAFEMPPKLRYVMLWPISLAALRFYLMDISLGQTNIFIALFLVLFLISYVRNKYVLSGLSLAFVFHFKPSLVFILIYFLLTGRIKIVISAIIGFFLLMIIPAYMLGIEKVISLTRDWIDILNMSIPSQILNSKNQSLTYAIGDTLLKLNGVKIMFGNSWKLFSFISAALMSLVYLTMLHLRRYEKNPGSERFKYLEVSLLIISCLLFSPISWEAHYAAILIPFSVALYFGMARMTDKKLWYSLGMFLLLSCVVGTDLTKHTPYINSFHSVNIGAGGLFLMFALIYGYKQKIGTVPIFC